MGGSVSTTHPGHGAAHHELTHSLAGRFAAKPVHRVASAVCNFTGLHQLLANREKRRASEEADIAALNAAGQGPDTQEARDLAFLAADIFDVEPDEVDEVEQDALADALGLTQGDYIDYDEFASVAPPPPGPEPEPEPVPVPAPVPSQDDPLDDLEALVQQALDEEKMRAAAGGTTDDDDDDETPVAAPLASDGIQGLSHLIQSTMDQLAVFPENENLWDMGSLGIDPHSLESHFDMDSFFNWNDGFVQLPEVAQLG